MTSPQPPRYPDRYVTGSGRLEFGDVLFAVGVFDDVPSALVAEAAAIDLINGSALDLCFRGSIIAAQSDFTEAGQPLDASYPASIFTLSSGIGAHVVSGVNATAAELDVQVHTLRRDNVVGFLVTGVSNDTELFEAIPELLCTFEQRLDGSQGPASSECLASVAAFAAQADEQPPSVVASGDSGNSTPGDTAAPPTDGTATPPPNNTDDSDDVNPGGRIAGGTVPAVLIHPDGPGGWTSAETTDGWLYQTGFNVNTGTTSDVLDFYQSAFASLGAQTVTVRTETPIGGRLSATGPGGEGTIEILKPLGSNNKSISGSFLQRHN